MVISVPAGVSQQATGAADAGRREDIYAVYSAIFANRNSSAGVVLIDAKTFPVRPDPPPNVLPVLSVACFQIPPSHATAWSEVVAETNTRKNSPGTLERELEINTPYVLLNEADVREIQPSIERGVRPQNPKFQGARSVTSLGDVYFNQKRTLALTSIGTFCGSLCGSGSDLVFEKGSDGKWQARPDWVTCSWVS